MLRVDLLQPNEIHERKPAERRVVDRGAPGRRRFVLEGCRRDLQAVQEHGSSVGGRPRPQHGWRLAARREAAEPEDRPEQEGPEQRPQEGWWRRAARAPAENVAARLVRQREMLGDLARRPLALRARPIPLRRRNRTGRGEKCLYGSMMSAERGSKIGHRDSEGWCRRTPSSSGACSRA